MRRLIFLVTLLTLFITTPAYAGDWLSGAGLPEQGNVSPGKYFGDWRGTPIEIGQTWVDSPDVWGINPSVSNSWANWTGPLSISFSPGSSWRSWSSTARGSQDAWWRAAARQTAKYRQGKGTTYIALFYEYNGDWFPWSVSRTSKGYRDFKNGWVRIANIWRQEFPQAKLVLPGTCGRSIPTAMLPPTSSYDIVGCTSYNNWPWQSNGSTALSRLETGRQLALSVGKPFAITEWANSANSKDSGGGGEATQYMQAMFNWLTKNGGTGPGQVVFETVFNIPGYSASYQLYPNTTQPLTANKYRSLW